MKKNYIAPAVEIQKAQPASIIAASLLDAAGTDLHDDITVEDPDYVQTKFDTFSEELEW